MVSGPENLWIYYIIRHQRHPWLAKPPTLRARFGRSQDHRIPRGRVTVIVWLLYIMTRPSSSIIRCSIIRNDSLASAYLSCLSPLDDWTSRHSTPQRLIQSNKLSRSQRISHNSAPTGTGKDPWYRATLPCKFFLQKKLVGNTYELLKQKEVSRYYLLPTGWISHP